MRKYLSMVLAVVLAVGSGAGLKKNSVCAEDEAPEGYYSVPLQNPGAEFTGGDDTFPGFMDESVYTTGYTDCSFSLSDYQYAEISSTYAHSGCSSLRIYDSEHGGSTRVLTNAVPVKPGEVYSATFWAYVPAGTLTNPRGEALTVNTLNARFKSYHANGSEKNVQSSGIATVNATSVKDGWAQYTISDYTIPALLSYLKIEFYTAEGGYVDAYVDDIKLYKKNSEYTYTALSQPRTYNNVVVKNAGFEDANNTSWNLAVTATDTNKMEFVSDKYFEGSKSMHYVDKDTAASGVITKVVSEYYTAAPGDVLRGSIKGYLNTASGAEAAMYAKLNFYDSNKTLLSTSSSDLYKKVISLGRWGSYNLDEKTAPAKTAFVRIEFYNVAKNINDSYIDSVQLYSTGTCEVEAAPATFTDLTVLNPGFESNTDNWELYGSNLSDTVNYDIATDIVHNGSKSLRVYDDNKTDAGVMFATPMYKVQSEGTYEASSYIYNKHDGTTGSRSLLFIDEFDGSGVFVKSNYVGSGSVTGDYTYNQWKQYTLQVTVQPETRYIRVVVGCSNAWNSLSSYFDDITLRVMDEDEVLYVGDTEKTVSDSTVTYSLPIINTKAVSTPITFITAAYTSDGRLVDVKVSANTSAVAASTTLQNVIGKAASISYVKNYVWDGAVTAVKPYYMSETSSIE